MQVKLDQTLSIVCCSAGVPHKLGSWPTLFNNPIANTMPSKMFVVLKNLDLRSSHNNMRTTAIRWMHVSWRESVPICLGQVVTNQGRQREITKYWWTSSEQSTLQQFNLHSSHLGKYGWKSKCIPLTRSCLSKKHVVEFSYWRNHPEIISHKNTIIFLVCKLRHSRHVGWL